MAYATDTEIFYEGMRERFGLPTDKDTEINITNMNHREIIFRGRRKDNGEWEEGNYVHNIRKGEFHAIQNKDTNETHKIYRESLQMKNWEGEFENI